MSKYFMATHAHVDRLIEIGERVLDELRPLVEELYGDVVRDAWSLDAARSQTLGRELGMALFLAGRGDVRIHRTALVEGLGHAIGEVVAQQPKFAGDSIRLGLTRGIIDGHKAASAAFVPGGQG